MVIPPSYGDLGKGARDLFGKGFNYGQVKVECKTKTSNGIQFTTNGNANLETSKIAGSLESKYDWKEYGLTVSEKWNTDNVISSEIALQDQVLNGMKITFNTSFAPATGKKSGTVKTAFKRDHVNLSCDVDFDFAGPKVHGAAVFWYNGFLAGHQLSFDTAKSAVTKNNFALSYVGKEFTLHGTVQDLGNFEGSVHQKLGKKLETGVNFAWSKSSNATRFGIAAKYDMDRDTSFRVKVNNQAQIGCAYSQNVQDGVKLTLSGLLEAKNINAGGHKVGLGLEFNA